MTTVKLIAVEDPACGELGLLVQGTPLLYDEPMAAFEGMVVAHDLLEHVNGVEKIGSIDDELEALGCLWYIRGQHGEIRRGSYDIPVRSLAHEVTHLGTYYAGRGINFRTPAPKTRAHDFDDDFREALELARSDLIAELECYGDPIDFDRVNEYMAAALHYLRRGARKAARKYPDAHAVNNLFEAIAEAVDRLPKPEYPSQQFTLTYTKDGHVHAEEHYDWEDE